MNKTITSATIILLSLFSFVSFAQKSAPSPKKNVPVAEFFPGGQDSMYFFIDKNLNYPIAAKRNRMQGECIIGLTINEQGKITAATVVKNIGGGCGEEALRLAKLLNFKAPGYKLQTSVPIFFRL